MDQLVNTADQQQLPLTPPEDAPPPAIEIDEETGAVTEKAADAPPDSAPKPQPRKRANERLTNALRERDEYAARAQQAEERARQAEERAASAKAAESAAMASGMENYAQRVQSDVASAREAYKAALKSEDPDAIADAAQKLSEVAAQKSDVDAWRASQGDPKAAKPAEPPAPPRQQQPEVIIPSEPTRQFFEENEWFHPLKLDSRGVPMVGRDGRPIQNPDYDEDMHDAAMLLHKKIERQVKKGERDADYIESPEYFQEIKAELAAAFPDAFEDAEPPPARRTPQMAPARQAVAPATRNTMPGAPKKAGAKLSLDGEQAELVRSMVNNGTIRYPAGHKMAGKVMELNDAYQAYAIKAADPNINPRQ